MKIRVYFLLFISLICHNIRSQSLHKPLSGTVLLAGNYSELRKNHFHMGLDFRTDGKENLPVYASDNGYVSRILISPNGYGKCIYINHPQLGITTVYAHLNSFHTDIQNYIEKIQYSTEQNTIDTVITPHLLPIVKGNQIGLSGNSGSSSGPHLHYEIRDMYSEKTINPMLYFSDIVDNIKPSISKIVFYQLEDNQSKYLSSFSPNTIQNQVQVLNYPRIGIAIAGYDQMNNSTNKFGIYQFRLYENDHLLYNLKFDSLDFAWQSHIKVISDYNLPINDVYKLFFEPCGFNITNPKAANAIVSMTVGQKKKITVEVLDARLNSSKIDFFLEANSIQSSTIPVNVNMLKCETENNIESKNFTIDLPAQCLSSDMVLKFQKSPPLSANELLRYSIQNEHTPILKPYSLTYTGQEATHPSKLYLHTIIENKPKSYIGSWNDGVWKCNKIKNFGNFVLQYDLSPPTVSAYTKSGQNLIWIISDPLSGIATYNLWIDNQWRKMYYDEKSKRIIARVSSLDNGKNLKLVVTDRVGNTTQVNHVIK